MVRHPIVHRRGFFSCGRQKARHKGKVKGETRRCTQYTEGLGNYLRHLHERGKKRGKKRAREEERTAARDRKRARRAYLDSLIAEGRAMTAVPRGPRRSARIGAR